MEVTALFVKRENSSAMLKHKKMTLGFNLRTWFVMAGTNFAFCVRSTTQRG